MEFRPKKILALLVLSGLLVAMFSGVVFASPPWSDAPSSWWTSGYGVTDTQVATVADGFPDGTFHPAQAVTRGQFAKMAVSGLGIATNDPTKDTFKDVGKTSPFFIYVEGAYAADLIGGYPIKGSLYFKPGQNITRQQADSILGRYLSGVEISVTGAIHGNVTNYGSLEQWYSMEGVYEMGPYDDASKVATSHKPAVAYLIYRNIVKGSSGKLTPTATLSRAQAAALILRVESEVESIKTPPGAPSNLSLSASSGKVISFDTATQQYVGNDPSPQVTGDTLAGRPIAIYDSGVKLVEDSSNSAGKFYTDLTTPLIDGLHTFTAKVKNANGLVSNASAAITYLLDTVAPIGTITKPIVPSGKSAATVGVAKPDFAASVTDDRSGVKQVEFQCAVKQTTPSWQSVCVDTTPDPGTNLYTATWPSSGALSTGLSDGSYLFRVVMTDKAGNVGTSATTEVTVDTTKPTVTISAPVAAGIYYTESSTPTFTATAVDTASGGVTTSNIASVQFYYTPWSASGMPTSWAGFTLLSTDTTLDYAATYPAGGLPEGHYLFAVKATDLVGNESALMNGNSYVAGVTQEVIIDRTAPVITVTGPYPGQKILESQFGSPAQQVNITWTLQDLTPPDTVALDYTLDATATNPVWVAIDHAAPNTGSYVWNVPDVTGDKVHCVVRVYAVDKAGPQVGNVSGHTTAAMSSQFTIYDLPSAISSLTAKDNDSVNAGVDGRDFTVTWTPSPSPDIASQAIYILKGSDTSLDMTNDTPVAVFNDNTTSSWTGTASLTTDSKHATLAVGVYRVGILVTDIGGHTGLWWSDTFTVSAP